MKVAMLIIDMQKQFKKEMQADPNLESVIEHINYVAGMVRKAGQLVVLVQDVEGITNPLDPGIEVMEEIDKGEADIRIRKEESNAFWQTELDGILKERGVDYVIVSGFSAEHCVLFSYQGARERGYTAALLRGGISSPKPDVVTAAYRDRELASWSTIKYLLGAIEKAR